VNALGWVAAGLPLAGAAAVVLLRRRPAAPFVALAAAVLALAVAVTLPWRGGAGALLRVDALAAHMAMAVGLCGLLALWLGRAAPVVAAQGLAMQAGLLLAVMADGPVLAWVGLEGAVLALLLAPARAGEAAWRAAVALVPALGLAVLGALVLWLAAGGARSWVGLAEVAAGLAPGLLSLAWMLLVAGLATIAGLAPLHGWMRAAWRGGVASWLPALGAVALVLLLRAREVVIAQDDAVEPGLPLLALGLASLAWAALGLWREDRPARDAALFVAGLAAVAFGLGGDAVPAGLVLLTAGVVLGPLVVFGPGRVRAAALAALALLPPFPGFGAALALLGEAADGMPALAVPLAALMVAGAGGLARAALASWRVPAAMPRRDLLPAGLVLAGLIVAGMVPAAARWFEFVAEGLR
jgi:hydrogenase-4 component F